ncbi:MAG: hypothetical protein ABMB14_22920 [Myxococcota bacterium]
MSAIVLLSCAFSGPAHAATDDGADVSSSASDLKFGPRIGFGAGFATGVEPLAMVSAGADIRLVRPRLFAEAVGGLYLPSTDYGLSYGGASLDLSAGWRMTETAVVPYLGAGASARLQVSRDSVIGFAPFAQLGVSTALTPSTDVFAEVRVYQNLLPVGTPRGLVHPTEGQFAIGILF